MSYNFLKISPTRLGEEPNYLIVDNILDQIVFIILEKIQLSIQDGRGHSSAITNDELPLIAISTWPCSKLELKEYWTKQHGSYVEYLADRAVMAGNKGNSCFIHLFFCYSNTQQTASISCSYINGLSGFCIIPEELKTDQDNQLIMSMDKIKRMVLNNKTDKYNRSPSILSRFINYFKA
jgi:hypothetical protein